MKKDLKVVYDFFNSFVVVIYRMRQKIALAILRVCLEFVMSRDCKVSTTLSFKNWNFFGSNLDFLGLKSGNRAPLR
jgi:hypothetical protein